MSEKERKGSVISIAIKDRQALYMAYMPFLKNGGIFIPTKKDFEMGKELFLLLQIIDEDEPIKIQGKIVWITPAGALGNRPQGVGVQFTGDNATDVVALIEKKLGATLSLTRATHTM